MNFESALIAGNKKENEYKLLHKHNRFYKILKPFRPQKGGLR